MTIRPARLAAPLAMAFAIAACGGGSDDAASSTVATASSAPTTSTTVAPTTTAPPTTPPTSVPETTAPGTTAPATTVPATTAPPTTVASTTPSTPPPPPTTVPPFVPGPAPATFFATTDFALVEVDVATGEIVRTIDDFFTGEGIFRGYIRLTPDRSTIYFSEDYEDGWYTCETSIGSIGSIDLETAAIEPIAVGNLPELGPDATKLISTDSNTCLPDPQQPDFWVLTPTDRVVVRDLAGGDTVEYPTAPSPDSYEAPSVVRWADMTDDGSLLVQLGTGDVHRIPPGAAGNIQDFPVAFTTTPETQPWELIGDWMIAVVVGTEGSNDLVRIDITNGAVTPLASSETFMAIGVGDAGQLLAVSDTEITVEPGVDITIVDLPPDGFYYDVDW